MHLDLLKGNRCVDIIYIDISVSTLCLSKNVTQNSVQNEGQHKATVRDKSL